MKTFKDDTCYQIIWLLVRISRTWHCPYNSLIVQKSVQSLLAQKKAESLSVQDTIYLVSFVQNNWLFIFVFLFDHMNNFLDKKKVELKNWYIQYQKNSESLKNGFIDWPFLLSPSETYYCMNISKMKNRFCPYMFLSVRTHLCSDILLAKIKRLPSFVFGCEPALKNTSLLKFVTSLVWPPKRDLS